MPAHKYLIGALTIIFGSIKQCTGGFFSCTISKNVPFKSYIILILVTAAHVEAIVGIVYTGIFNIFPAHFTVSIHFPPPIANNASQDCMPFTCNILFTFA